MPAKKKNSSSRLPLYLLVLIGGLAAGWFASPPEKQKQYKKIAEEAAEDLPGTLEKLTAQASKLDSIWLLLGRFYDDKVPQDIRDTMAEGIPSLFAYPYICKVSRVISNQAVGSAMLLIEANGQEAGVPAGALIRPGTKILSTTPPVGAEIECMNLKIVIQPGSQASFLRGKGSQKVLDIRGSAQFAATNRSTAAGLYFPWGEVGIVTNEVASQYNVRMNGDKPLLEIFSGKTEVIWRVGEISSAGHELFQIVASPGAQVKLSREHSSGLESRDIGPKRQASFLANGSMSGSVGAVRLPPKSVATSSSAPPPAAAPVEDIPGLSILMPQMALKTEGSTIDVLLEWRFNPGARVIPCDIEMAADAELTKPLAKYQSADMRLLLKGMRPGIYFWRVSCAVDGTQQTSSTAKIQVQDGRKSAAIPILQAPANRAKISNSSVVYQWERVDSARSYVLQLSRDPKFTKMNEYYARSGTALKMNLKKRGVYYWRVYGITGTTKADRTGFSATYSFTY